MTSRLTYWLLFSRVLHVFLFFSFLLLNHFYWFNIHVFTFEGYWSGWLRNLEKSGNSNRPLCFSKWRLNVLQNWLKLNIQTFPKSCHVSGSWIYFTKWAKTKLQCYVKLKPKSTDLGRMTKVIPIFMNFTNGGKLNFCSFIRNLSLRCPSLPEPEPVSPGVPPEERKKRP